MAKINIETILKDNESKKTNVIENRKHSIMKKYSTLNNIQNMNQYEMDLLKKRAQYTKSENIVMIGNNKQVSNPIMEKYSTLNYKNI